MSRVASSVTRTVLASLLVSGVLTVGTAFAGDDVGSVNFVLGYKSLTRDWTLGPSGAQPPGRASQPGLGVEFTWGRSDWPVRIAFDVLHSYDDGITHVPRFFTVPAYDVRLRASTLELALGLRRGWTLRSFTPYLGAGGEWARGNAAVEVSDPRAGQFGAPTSSARARSSAFGSWVGGGLACRLGPRFQIGVAGRFSKATLPSEPFVDDQGTVLPGGASFPRIDGGGRHINLVVGWSFPNRQ